MVVRKCSSGAYSVLWIYTTTKMLHLLVSFILPKSFSWLNRVSLSLVDILLNSSFLKLYGNGAVRKNLQQWNILSLSTMPLLTTSSTYNTCIEFQRTHPMNRPPENWMCLFRSLQATQQQCQPVIAHWNVASWA